MKTLTSRILFSALALAIATPSFAQFDFSTANGLFTPSFRGQTDTTWFGWGPGKFDGPTNNEIIDNPPPSLGTTTVGLSFTQTPTSNDILSGSDNIYSSTAGATDLLLSIPVTGGLSFGYTTIIVQGRTAFGGYQTPPSFGAIAGIEAEFSVGMNLGGAEQFWAKYEIPGNAGSYGLAISLAPGSFTSITELQVDTKWSASGYASDNVNITPVPEPGTIALLGTGVALLGMVVRRRNS